MCVASHRTTFIPGNPQLLNFYIPFLDAIYYAGNYSITIFAHRHLGLSLHQRRLHLPRHLFPEPASANTTTSVLGSWFIQERSKKACPKTRRVGASMLFPTISEICSSPNEKILALIFRPPRPRTTAYLSMLVQHTPLWLLRLVMYSWPESQVQVLRRF
ncbi:hypothetical protein EI94DRAFT_1809659 [Lactarius quietus]|nr:hypothetical protein EI94DRAFT_1809659 [Lactarius quietus]